MFGKCFRSRINPRSDFWLESSTDHPVFRSELKTGFWPKNATTSDKSWSRPCWNWVRSFFYYFETFLLFCNVSILLQHFYSFATFLYISNIVMTPKIFWSPCKSDFWKVITSLELTVDFYHYPIGLGAYFGYKFHGFVFYP